MRPASAAEGRTLGAFGPLGGVRLRSNGAAEAAPLQSAPAPVCPRPASRAPRPGFPAPYALSPTPVFLAPVYQRVTNNEQRSTNFPRVTRAHITHSITPTKRQKGNTHMAI